jgi:hypothetical protein
MKSTALRLVCVIFGLLSAVARAYEPEEGKISLTFGPTYYRTFFQADHPLIDPEQQHGFAVIAEGSVGKRGSLEIGVFPMHKVFIREQQNNFVAEQIKLIYITMGYRQWFSNRVSGALALFSSYPMGDAKVLQNDLAPGGYLDTSARDATEYGFDFSVMVDLLNQPKFSVTLDARYSLSVTNKDNEESDHLMGMIGVRYLLQKKGRRPPGKK